MSSLRGRRIVFVFCSPELGGAERQGLCLAQHLQGLGADVRVWSTAPGEGLVRQRCAEAGIPFAVHPFRWPCRKNSLLRHGWGLLQAMRRERPDVLLPYTTSPNLGCGLVWRLSPAQACIWGQRNTHGLTGHALERRALRACSAIVCNAAHTAAFLREAAGAHDLALHVVPNGVALAAPQQSREAWRAATGIASGATAVVMLANFRGLKRHDVMVAAWLRLLAARPAGLPPPVLLLAGAAVETHAAVQRQIEDLGLATSIQMLGQIADVGGLLAAADIGVLCSDHEGLPNALLEYMAAGLPVVATDVPGNREALGDDARQPLTAPGDPAQLALALGALVADAARRQQAGARNRQRAADAFSLESMCTRMTDVVEEALARGRRRGRGLT